MVLDFSQGTPTEHLVAVRLHLQLQGDARTNHLGSLKSIGGALALDLRKHYIMRKCGVFGIWEGRGHQERHFGGDWLS